jgi:hypothetical protein
VRTAARTDDNQAEIVTVLERFGCSVFSTASTGRGFPDLVVGLRGHTYLIEVKDGAKPPSARTLTPDQRAWRARWRGAPPFTLETVDQAIAFCLQRIPAQR